MICKFCGAEFTTEKYTAPAPGGRSCGKCTQYCMRECEKVKTAILSWHAEPCLSCDKNPYKFKSARLAGAINPAERTRP